MSRFISSFFGKTEKPEPISVTPPEAPPVEKKKGRKAQLIALKATGPGGLIDEANIARKKILV